MSMTADIQPGDETGLAEVGAGAAGPAYSPFLRRDTGWGVRFTQAVAPVTIALAVLLLLWQWYASQPEVDPLLLPTPLAVWHALVTQRDVLWRHTLVTLSETMVGFGAALV